MKTGMHGVGTVIDEATGNHPQYGPSAMKLVEYTGGKMGMELTFGGKTNHLERSPEVCRDMMAKFRALCGC